MKKISSFFTHSMNRGHFAVPCAKWQKEFDKIDQMFLSFHPTDGLKKGPGCRNDFLNILKKKFPHRSEEILKLCVQLRSDIPRKTVNLNVKIKKKKRLSERAQKKLSNY